MNMVEPRAVVCVVGQVLSLFLFPVTSSAAYHNRMAHTIKVNPVQATVKQGNNATGTLSIIESCWQLQISDTTSVNLNTDIVFSLNGSPFDTVQFDDTQTPPINCFNACFDAGCPPGWSCANPGPLPDEQCFCWTCETVFSAAVVLVPGDVVSFSLMSARGGFVDSVAADDILSYTFGPMIPTLNEIGAIVLVILILGITTTYLHRRKGLRAET